MSSHCLTQPSGRGRLSSGTPIAAMLGDLDASDADKDGAEPRKRVEPTSDESRPRPPRRRPLWARISFTVTIHAWEIPFMPNQELDTASGCFSAAVLSAPPLRTRTAIAAPAAGKANLDRKGGFPGSCTQALHECWLASRPSLWLASKVRSPFRTPLFASDETTLFLLRYYTI